MAVPSVFSAESGRPFRLHFTPDEHGGHAQTWSLVQDDRGLIYVGNNHRVLEYDGVAWRHIPIPNESIARGLALDDHGTVFVGAQDEVGYLAAGRDGVTRYVSLLDALPPEDRAFGDVWRVVVLSDGVYFQSTRQIMRWDGRPPMRVWRTATRFRPATAVRDTLFVSEDGRGLLALAGDTLALVPGGDVFADRPVYAVLPLPGGGLIVGTASDGLFRRSGGAFVPMPTGADDALRNGFLYTGVVLPGGPLAFGTIRRGGVVLAPDGRLLRRLDPSTGVPEDPILNLAVDREGALWVVQDGGLVRLETNNPMTVFDEALGIGGTVEAVARHRGRLYAATREGLRRLEPGPAGIPRFAPVPGFDGQIWDLVDAGETLLVASAGGVYALRDGRAENLLLAGHAYALYPDPDRPGRVWAGLGDGLAVLERRAGRWTAGRVAASDGAFDTRVQITWSNAGVDASQGLRIRRDGVEIDQVGAGATSYNDFDAAPGTLALYGVESVATGGTAGCDYGWTPPDGSISGRVASRLGGGIGDVAVCLDPNPNKALLFDGEGGTAVVQGVALPDSFTVELWVRPAALTGRQDLIALPNLRLGLTGAKLRLDYGTASGIESADLMTPAWQHLALTVHQNRTGPTSDVRLYRDGILVLSTSFNQVLDTGTHDWSFSGDTTNGDYYSGRLDEVRWWSGVKPADVLAASAAEARPLTGNEDGLLAYWPMDQGTGRIAGDRSGGNAHAAFAGGAYWTDDSAPLEACGTTDAKGNYTVAGLRYGSGTTFTVTPALGARTFDPAFKKITLNTNSPVQNEVDFTDVSAFTIAGTVQFAGTTCPVPDADVYLDGVFKGKTESDGTYSIAADLGKRTVEVRLGEAGDAHPFTPASATVTVEDDVRGLDFTDGKTRRLSGYFGGSCHTGIVTATIRIFTANGCFEKVIETSGNYAVDLPPQKYLVQVTGVETTNTQLKADILAFFDNLGAQEVDLTAQADTLDLIYRAPLALAISGLSAPPASCPAGFNGGSLPAVPVLTQGDEYPLTIYVFEDYGNGQTCPLDEGSVTVTDGLGHEAVVTTLNLVDGQTEYTTRAGDPDIFSGRTVEGVNRSFQKSINVVAQVAGRTPVSETAWAVIDGMKARTATFVSATTGEIPLMILHDPPGSESYSYIEEGTTVCNSISHMKLSGGIPASSSTSCSASERPSAPGSRSRAVPGSPCAAGSWAGRT